MNMQVKRFSLGIRLELCSGSFSSEDAREAVEAVFSALDAESVRGLEVYGGRCALNDNDSESVYTLILTNGGLKQMRGLYKMLQASPALTSVLAGHRPYIMTNTLSRLPEAEYLGEFSSDGKLLGGESRLDISVRSRRERQVGAEGRGLRVLLVPDKFKGSLTSAEAIRSIARAAKRVLPGCRTVSAIMADGGDGTADALIRAFDGVKRSAVVAGPLGERVKAEYGIIGGNTAVIEMAKASGLSLISASEKLNPMRATSRGTGELIADAIKFGARHILIGLGGSATNDAGMGAAIALGVKFFDAEGRELEGCGEDMARAVRLELDGMEPRLRDVDIHVLCDVNNPLTGENGATMVYGAQKGADTAALGRLEAGMLNMERLYDACASSPVCSLEGCGAAGGMGAMLRALLGAELIPGAEAMLKAIRFDEMLKKVDMVVTGEGCLDAASVSAGKAVGAVIRHAAARKVPVAVLAGRLGDGSENALSLGRVEIRSCVDEAESLEYAMENAESLLEHAAEKLFRDIASAYRLKPAD